MISLPIDESIPEIFETLRAHNAMVLIAPPGAGKTTRVPSALLPLMTTEHPHIIMLQPRRVAARAAAQRIADENGWQFGREVGYHIRFEKRYGHATRIRVLTEAILTRMMLDDPYLDGIGCVILDEFHERNLHTDLAAAFLREVQQTVRPTLKIAVMSATMDPQPVSRFLGGAPIVVTQGRTYPVEIAYRPGRDVKLESHVAHVIEEALTNPGDILIFLPGVGEIERTRRALAGLENEGIALLPLHGSLSSEEQQRALAADSQGRRKVVLATNIAETSLTIDGVRTVIDAGLARVASFDPARGMDRLDLERISRASADQRAGRAGRQAAGVCFRLWSEQEQKHLAPFNIPEVERVDLAPTVLSLHAWGAADARAFAWFEAPSENRLLAAEELLKLLGALHEGKLTDTGKTMLALPVHPRIARLLIAAAGTPILEDAISLATILSSDARRTSGDLLTGLERLPEEMRRARDQLATIARGLPRTKNAARELPELLLLAYPDRVVKRRADNAFAGVMVGGNGVRLAPESLTPAIAAAPLFLALDVQHDPGNKRAEALVRTAVPLTIETLERLLPTELRTENALIYNEPKEKVTATTRRYFNDLILEEDPHGRVDPAKSGDVLATALAPRARELFIQNEPAARLLARVALVQQTHPTAGWPACDDEQLQETLRNACAGKRTLAELTEGPALPNALRELLIYPLDRQLEELAPETIEVPSGSKIRVDYALSTTPGAPLPAPVLAVRLQELFGLLDTPRIAAGRVQLLLHLLSPGYKPMQITSDLRSFWGAAYYEVRKDLRARYPKHKWPDDPLTAVPEAKGRPRR